MLVWLVILILVIYLPSYTTSATECIRVKALIDGKSHLLIRGYIAQWRHVAWCVPGSDGDRLCPTVINGTEWFPTWPGLSRENAHVQEILYSDAYTDVDPPLPTHDSLVTLRHVAVRHRAAIIQSPHAGNNFTLIIEFDDNVSSNDPYYTHGPFWYEVEIEFPRIAAARSPEHSGHEG
jgi:hypothetical protein